MSGEKSLDNFDVFGYVSLVMFIETLVITNIKLTIWIKKYEYICHLLAQWRREKYHWLNRVDHTYIFWLTK